MLSRVLRMELDEVAERGIQEASKLQERFYLRVGPKKADGSRPQSQTGSTPSKSAFFAQNHDRFFLGASEDWESSPSRLGVVRDRAERIVDGRFDLLGYTNLSFGEPIDWSLDPISGRRAPSVHWSLVDPTDFAAVGDTKVVWELNRQQHLLALGVAYRLTGDERYALTFSKLVREWQRANPERVGINWVSSLEASLRILSWSWALFLFESSAHLSPELFQEMASAIQSHASHVERYLSRYSSPNTHLTGEALGLFYAGLLFPENAAAENWRATGEQILNAQISIQVLADGVYFEQSTAYQSYTVEIYLHYLILASRNQEPVPSNVRDTVLRMLDVLLSLRRPDGSMPAIGDSDGGSLLPLFPRAPEDCRGLFALAAAFFERPDYAWASEGVQPEVSWVLGRNATLKNEPQAPARDSSEAFREGGCVVMRSGWRPDSHQLIFDAGPLGCPLSGAHGHADLLSVQVSPFGEPGIVDPGTFAYAASPAYREFFRGTRAHSTVLVDGETQAETTGPFKWRDRPAAVLSAFVSNALFTLADASHPAYHRLKDPVTHRRRVVFIKNPGCFLLIDDLLGAAAHGLDLRFQFAAVEIDTASDEGWIRAITDTGRGLLVRTLSNAALSVRVAKGSTSPIEGWVSPHYGQRVPAPVVIFSATAPLPLRIVTLLVPSSSSTMAPPRVTADTARDSWTLDLRFDEKVSRMIFDGQSFDLETEARCRA